MDFFVKKWVKQNSDSLTGFLDSKRGRVTAVVVLVGGGAGLFKYWKDVKKSRKIAEREFVKEAAGSKEGKAGPTGRSSKVAVDRVFFKRLGKIVRILIPSIRSTEFAYIAVLTVLLFARTILSVVIAEIAGSNAQFLVSRRWREMLLGVRKFALVTIPAAVVNSGLGYFKPLLDVVLFTYNLGNITGWQGPLIMYGYFVISAFIKKNIMPSFGKLVAKESELEGYYRTAHQRLITNSEEIAFYDGSKKERKIIESALKAIYSHVSYVRYLRGLIGIFDGLLVKYWASIIGYIVLASPLLLGLERTKAKGSEELTRDYIRNTQYLTNLAKAVGQLVLVGNKLTNIAGYTARVSELLEMVKYLNNVGNKPFELAADETKPEEFQEVHGIHEWLSGWRSRCDAQHDTRIALRRTSGGKVSSQVVGGGRLVEGDVIRFEGCDIVSPDGKLLVQQLNFEVRPGRNVMVTGPNGAGKSSLFRLIGELWPLHSGVLTKPPKEDILFIPQKPYLVLGNLRDQIIYPHSLSDMQALGVTDADLARLLAVVDPAQNITRTWGWDEVKDWFHAFSGGQKQRVAMARLFYHRPKFAILDECTSAVSDEVEDAIYETCKELGITIFTVSHRVSLRRHHDIVLRFDGRGKWETYTIEKTDKEVRE